MSDKNPARVRFAPSPTGHMHLGSARTALYDYLLARQTGGQFILRIEDTDKKRYVPGTEEELCNGLRWLGIPYDEGPDIGGPTGPYRQSERKEIYQEYARKLVESGHAYYCFCTSERLDQLHQEQMKLKEQPHYDGHCRKISLQEADLRRANSEKYVIRFKTPDEGVTIAHDVLRGDIAVENRTIDDYILVKTDGWALYHLAAMVDDYLMKVTHVIRGAEWLATFPLHVMIIRAFGWTEPKWLHLSVFLKPSGKGKMSKREASELIKDGYSIFIKDFDSLGYLPEAVINWIALMGWSYDDHTEFFTLPDLVEKFSIEKLNPSPAAINFTKLDYFNGLHIRSLTAEDLAHRIEPFFAARGIKTDFQTLVKIAPIIQERLSTLDDALDFAAFFFQDDVKPIPEELVAKGLTPAQSSGIARKVLEILSSSPELTSETAEPPMRRMVEESELTAGQVFGILRAAVTGQKVSPPLFESMEIIGKEKVLARIRSAISILDSLATRNV
jgi:glutamyl-tRNA synthetase